MTTLCACSFRLTQWVTVSLMLGFSLRVSGELSLAVPFHSGDFVLFDGLSALPVFVETNDSPAVIRAAGDLVGDVERVTGRRPALLRNPANATNLVIVGTLGMSPTIDRLAKEGKIDVNGVRGEWESYVLQIVSDPMPGVARALVIAGSDRRGTIYGIYQLSELIGVSPWYWWADVPVERKALLALHGDRLKQGPPGVKYRGIFLNDEDWCLRPWASKTFDPATGNIGPKTYAKVFELLLRLRANYLWPAMHPGTRAFNYYAADKELADRYGIVMGSSHCEQMLRDNVDEWARDGHGEYNFVTNPDGVLRYWEQRVRENGRFENIYTLGMRGIHDSGMPGGGTLREKADRLRTIIADQRAMLQRWVNTNVAAVPQIFCPYKEVLELYRLMPDLPEDITLVWPDDNYGYIREFSNATERRRSGGAGVYYHVSYYGTPCDYLWLCSTPPALIAEEMCKAYDYGANRVWILNVGDLKPAELDIEFFLKLAWEPHSWSGTNTYDLLGRQIARDFGPAQAPRLTAILAEYYRLNFQRKPEHMMVGLTNTFSTTLNGDEAQRRLEAWRDLAVRTVAVGNQLPPESHDAFFELVGYPVEAAAAMNEKCLALAEFYAGEGQNNAGRLTEAQQAQDEIQRLTDIYNNQIAGGKWRYMMSADPRGQLDLAIPTMPLAAKAGAGADRPAISVAPSEPRPETAETGADFVEANHCIIMDAAHASAFVPGKDARWRKIIGLGYTGEAVGVFPTLVPLRDEPGQIMSESPCLEYRIAFHEAGDWKFTVRTLPAFSVDARQPPRYAIAVDNEPAQVISLPTSMSESDRRWRGNVLRDAALTTSTHTIAHAGVHILKVWMVDPGIVIDAIAARTGSEQSLGYTWPAESHALKPANANGGN